MTTMDSPLPDTAAEAADSQPATGGLMGLAAVPCSALVELLSHALQTPIRDGGVLAINGGPLMSFDEARAFAKAHGFRSYLHLLDWIAENYGVPFKGEVVWPNAFDVATQTAPDGFQKHE